MTRPRQTPAARKSGLRWSPGAHLPRKGRSVLPYFVKFRNVPRNCGWILHRRIALVTVLFAGTKPTRWRFVLVFSVIDANVALSN